jgi:Winged helix-turn-helix DNA-binding
MPDLVDRIRAELDARIRDLRPLARELERLERAAAGLARAGARSVPGLRSRVGSAPTDPRTDDAADQKSEAASTPAKRKAPPKAQPRRKPAPRGRRQAKSAKPRRRTAPRGETRAKVLEALAASPGSSSAAIAKASGISPSVAAATISRLVKQGRVRRLDEGGYTAVETPTDYRPAAAAETGSDTGAGAQASPTEAPREPPPAAPREPPPAAPE